MNFQAAKEKLGRKLTNVSEVAAGVLRGIRRSNECDVAAYVFDLNNHLPVTVGELSSYLDEVMGPAYFDNDSSPDLRWNNYLYFVVDKDLASTHVYQMTKRNVEADRSYARKFVVIEEDFDRILDELDSVAVAENSTAATDVVQAWSQALSAVGLEDVLDEVRPIADVLRSISSGDARQSTRTIKTSGTESSQMLASQHIASIDLNSFRPYPKHKSYSFGKANLLFGSNGVGKTSLLEGLEFLYCGANRRSNADAVTAVDGTLVSGHLVKTSGQQPLSDFKTRQRIWYGGDDNSRQNKLPNQFARFNFLNTDASAELALKEGANEGHAASLAALLNGHEATLMWRRIQEVRKAIADDIRSKRSERAVAEKEKEVQSHKLSVLEAAPGQSDAVFSVFIKDLEQIGWREAPVGKQVVTEKIIEVLSSLTSKFSAIQQLDWLQVPITKFVVTEQASLLQRAFNYLNSELSACREDERGRAMLTRQHDLAQARLEALAAIPIAAQADLKTFSATLKQASDELAQNARVYSALPSIAPPDGWLISLGDKSLLTAHEEASARLYDLVRQLEVHQKRLAVSVRTKSELQRAMTELQSWSQKVVDHRHSDSNCPVCGTAFEPGELIHRIQALTVESSDTEILGLRKLIENLILKKKETVDELSWIGQLDRFTKTFSDTGALFSIHGAQMAVLSTIDRQKWLLEEKQTAQHGLDGYARSGLTLEVIEQLCSPIEGDDQQGSSPLDLSEALESAIKHRRKLQNVIAELDAQVLERNERLIHLIEETGVQSGNDLDIAIEQLMARHRVALAANDACAAAHRYLDISSDADMRSILTSLESSVLGAKKVQAALDSENGSATHLSEVREQLAQLHSRLSRIGQAIERLTAAHRILDDIVLNHSLDSASGAVIEATHSVANSIFGRIHAPAEYLITAAPETPLRRRDNNCSVNLNQVSTGQRAAYALSMFLAMNAQVKAGPKIIMLDDPISHIDDLNALSFLDYLRNLVINSGRQIFFATADEKVAGLFLHKFGFLGDEFQTIELVRE